MGASPMCPSDDLSGLTASSGDLIGAVHTPLTEPTCPQEQRQWARTIQWAGLSNKPLALSAGEC